MQPLNLPSYDIRIKNSAGKKYIFDQVRKKYLLLTPEEWVRQNFIHFLIEDLNYPKGLIKVEFGIKYNQRLSKRPDILVLDRKGKPFLLIECKSFEVTIKHDTLFQVATYNHQINAKFIALTNGLEHVCFQVNPRSGKIEFLDTFPAYPDLR